MRLRAKAWGRADCGWISGRVPLAMVGGFFASASISMFNPLMYTYTSENFPTR